MTTQERLVIYEQALKDYKNNHYAAIYSGFCHYFMTTHNIEEGYSSREFSIVFPELQQTKPHTNKYWWFEPKDTIPRTECLKQAIKLCKINLENERVQDQSTTSS